LNKSETKFISFPGKAYWTHVYKPDTFRGVSRWILNLYMEDKDWETYKSLGIQKKPVKDEIGTFWRPARLTSKLLGARGIVNFTPPFIYDKDGNVIVKYVDKDDKDVRSYTGEASIKRVGEPVLIGNGSSVIANVSVYNTQMGPGNRLESLRIVDLIEYAPEEKDENETAPW